MSFSSEQKKTIIDRINKAPCCRRALVQGALFAKGYVSSGTVAMSLERKEYADFVAKLVKEFYGRDATLSRSPDGGRRYILSFESNSAAHYISNIHDCTELFSQKCELCQSAFLRGVFLASARASDPKKNYSIHFTLGERAETFAKYLGELDLNPLTFDGENGGVVYFKDGSMIESFYGYAGMNQAMFSIIDARLKAEMRRNVARVSNCETNNIKKAVEAAGKQLDIITALEKANLLSSLPDDLETTARLRLAHPDMSLAQLSAISSPPISKPGLSHRLKKIIEIGERMLHTEKN